VLQTRGGKGGLEDGFYSFTGRTTPRFDADLLVVAVVKPEACWITWFLGCVTFVVLDCVSCVAGRYVVSELLRGRASLQSAVGRSFPAVKAGRGFLPDPRTLICVLLMFL